MYHGQANQTGGTGFPSTHWSFVQAIKNADTDTRRELIGQFLVRYSRALEFYLRYELHIRNPEERADILQSFALDKFVIRLILDHAAESRGKLRNYLKTCLANYTRDQRRGKARKMQRNQASYNSELHDAPTSDAPLNMFEVAWAKQVVAEAIERFERDCREQKRTITWEVFNHRLLNPIFGNIPATPVEELAKQLGIDPKRIYNQLLTARRVFSRHLRAIVGEYTGNEAETDLEIKELLNYLGVSEFEHTDATDE